MELYLDDNDNDRKERERKGKKERKKSSINYHSEIGRRFTAASASGTTAVAASCWPDCPDE